MTSSLTPPQTYERRQDLSQQNSHSMFVRVIDNWDELVTVVDEWDDLAQSASEPNVFYESWMLLPALRHLNDSNKVQIVLVYAQESQDRHHPATLCGLFPIEHTRHLFKLPISTVQFWNHPYCMLSTPLIRDGWEAPTISTFMQWISQHKSNSSLVRWNEISADGPIARNLGYVTQQRTWNSFLFGQYQRAFLRCDADGETYLQNGTSKQFRKKMRRLENRLSNQGTLDVREPERPEDLDRWLNQYFDLELRGWKGHLGTAVSQNTSHEAFFRAVVRSGFQRQRIRIPGLFLDEKPIAMQVNLFSPPGAFAFKTAFDEAHAKNSPGVLLEVHNTLDVHSLEDVEWMDSCAQPGHPTLDRIWQERRTIQSMFVSTGGFVGELVLSALPTLRTLHKTFFR